MSENTHKYVALPCQTFKKDNNLKKTGQNWDGYSPLHFGNLNCVFCEESAVLVRVSLPTPVLESS